MTLRSHLAALFLAAATLAPAQAHAQPQDRPQDKAPDQLRTMTHQELDVVKVVLAQEKAWNAGDIDGYADAYKDSPDLLFIGTHVSHGFAEVINDYHHFYPNKESMGQLTYSEIEPRPLDENFAVVVGKYHLERSKKAGGSADGFFSLVLEKTPKGWKIIVDHSV